MRALERDKNISYYLSTEKELSRGSFLLSVLSVHKKITNCLTRAHTRPTYLARDAKKKVLIIHEIIPTQVPTCHTSLRRLKNWLVK